MEFIEKHKALIITSMLMAIFVLSLYNINMIKKQKEQAEILMEIPEEFLMEEEQPEEEKEDLIAQEDRQLDNAKRTHNAFNEDFEDHNEIEERIKSLTEVEEIAQSEETAEEDELVLESENEKEEEPEEKANNRNSSLTFNLKNRKSINLPNPVYTCNGSGRVIVKIEVNKNGYVVDAKVDKKRSTTRNECLFDNAMDYARKALFSRTNIEKQEGSITYYFNYSN